MVLFDGGFRVGEGEGDQKEGRSDKKGGEGQLDEF